MPLELHVLELEESYVEFRQMLKRYSKFAC